MEDMKRKIKAEIIEGSLNEHGQRITTWVLTYPRMIHAEMMTHRVFSRNAASSRAIPSKVMQKLVNDDPFVPVAFQYSHPGMQGTKYFELEDEIKVLRDDWIAASQAQLSIVDAMDNFECTKQLTNRLLEPFQWYTAIFTSTETSNFMDLRCPSYEIDDELIEELKKR